MASPRSRVASLVSEPLAPPRPPPQPPPRPLAGAPVINNGSNLQRSRFRSEAFGSQPRPSLRHSPPPSARATTITESDPWRQSRLGSDQSCSQRPYQTNRQRPRAESSSQSSHQVEIRLKHGYEPRRSFAGSSPKRRWSSARTSTDSKVVEFHWDQDSIDRLGRLEVKFSWLCAQLGISFKEEADVDDDDDDDEENEKETKVEEDKEDEKEITNLTHVFYKQGTMQDAHHVFDGMPKQNFVQSSSEKGTPVALKIDSSSSKTVPLLPNKISILSAPYQSGNRLGFSSSETTYVLPNKELSQIQISTLGLGVEGIMMADFSQDLIEKKWRVNWKRKRWKLRTCWCYCH